MIEFAFTAEELTAHAAACRLALDVMRRYVLVGLTWEETAEYEQFARALRQGVRPTGRATQDRYLALHGRHLVAVADRKSHGISPHAVRAITEEFADSAPAIDDPLFMTLPGSSATITPRSTGRSLEEFQKMVAEVEALAAIGAVRIDFRRANTRGPGALTEVMRFTRV